MPSEASGRHHWRMSNQIWREIFRKRMGGDIFVRKRTGGDANNGRRKDSCREMGKRCPIYLEHASFRRFMLVFPIVWYCLATYTVLDCCAFWS